MGLNRNDLEVGKYYYYGNCIRKFKCLETGEVQSKFEDHKKVLHQFYNHDMYFEKGMRG